MVGVQLITPPRVPTEQPVRAKTPDEPNQRLGQHRSPAQFAVRVVQEDYLSDAHRLGCGKLFFPPLSSQCSRIHLRVMAAFAAIGADHQMRDPPLGDPLSEGSTSGEFDVVGVSADRQDGSFLTWVLVRHGCSIYWQRS